MPGDSLKSIEDEERAIIAFLVTSPAPDALLDLRPSKTFLARIATVLARSKEGGLSEEEEDRYEPPEHLVRMAKGEGSLRLRQGDR